MLHPQEALQVRYYNLKIAINKMMQPQKSLQARCCNLKMYYKQDDVTLTGACKRDTKTKRYKRNTTTLKGAIGEMMQPQDAL